MGMSIYALGKDEGEAIWFLNSLAIIKAASSQTDQRLGMVDNLLPPGFESPYHVHRAEDESFYILDGDMEFISEGNRFVRGAGSYVFLPRGIPHGIRVVGTSTARILILVSPGGFENFVREAGEPAGSLTLPVPSAPDVGKLVAIAAKHQIEILGPLPK